MRAPGLFIQPSVEAPERVRIAHAILMGGVVVTAAMLLASFILRPWMPVAHATFAAMVASHLLALTVLHRGFLRASIAVFALLYFVVVFRTVWIFGGIHVPAMMALPPIVLFVGLTSGGKSALATAIVASLGVLCFLGLDRADLLPDAPPVPSPFIAVVTMGVLVISAFMLSLALGIIERSRAAAAESGRAKDQLEERLAQSTRVELVGRLAAGVAHDFNNLLTVIFAEAELIGMDNHSSTAAAANILAAAERASALTRQLLAFGQRQLVTPELLDPADVIGKLQPLLRSLLGSHATLEVVLATELPPLRAGRTEVEQILLNLVTNARDAMDRGGKVLVSTGIADETLRARWPDSKPKPPAMLFLAVQDNGRGMDEQTRKRLFEPFFTTKEVGRGTGLGLVTVAGIAERIGGTVLVDTELGRGSTFTVLVPASTAKENAPGRTAMLPAAAHVGALILVVDDDEPVIASVTKILRGAGYAVVSARSASEALALAESWQRRPDLILTDVIMPGLTGPELVARLRDACPQLKAMFMSGYAEDRLSHRGLLRPGVHFIAKPLEPEVLCIKVATVLASANIGSLGAPEVEARDV